MRTSKVACLGVFVAAVIAGCVGCGSGTSSSGPGQPPPPPASVTVSVSQSSPTVLLGNTAQFSANVTGSSNTAVNWSVTGTANGSISAAGLYTAPPDLPSHATVTVTATSQADPTKSANATITITSDVSVSLQATPSGTASIAFNEALTLAATVTSSGNPDTSMAWAVNGVSNGNSVVGTISVSGSGVTYTAPASPAQVTITATSAADPSKSASLPENIQALNAGTLSNASPLPLTPVQIPTAGLDTTATVQVQFSNSTGFAVTENAIRVASDGTVVVAVPLYVDPSSGQIGPGTVSVTLAQRSQSTAPMMLNIQDLPTVSSYGTPLGQISHTFLNYQGMRIARLLGELQAFQVAPNNTVSTSQAQASLQTFLNAVIKARSDVDQISLDNSVVIGGGQLPNGTPVQFDQNSLDIMDRILGLYLTQFASIYSVPAAAPTQGAFSTGVPYIPALSAKLPRLTTHWGGGASSVNLHERQIQARSVKASASTSCSGLSCVLNSITVANNLTGITQAYSDAAAKDATTADKVLAIANGCSALYGLATVGGSVAQGVAGAAFGGLLSGYGLLQNFIMETGDLGAIYYYSRHGGDPATLQVFQDNLNENARSAAFNTINTELALASIGGVFGSFGSGVIGSFLNVENTGGQITLQSAGLLTGAYQCATSSPPCYQAIVNTAVALAMEVKGVFSTDTQGIGTVEGNVNVPTNQGSLAPLSGIELSSNGITLDTLADPGGNYQLFMPLQASPFDYVNTDVTIVDPVSQTTLGSEVVDLTGLNTASPLQIPTIQGAACSNVDFDGDDPDCD
jgi:hypothetical protein